MPSTAPIDQLVTMLEAAGIRATTNPGELSLPGAWVTLDDLFRVNVAGDWQLTCSVYLITGDTDDQRALEQLFALLDDAMAVLTPDGVVTVARVVLPTDATPKPALRVPVRLK